jgi:hypothetical protein
VKQTGGTKQAKHLILWDLMTAFHLFCRSTTLCWSQNFDDSGLDARGVHLELVRHPPAAPVASPQAHICTDWEHCNDVKFYSLNTLHQ